MSSAATGDLRIEQVTTKKGLNQFIDMPARLYADDPAWVAPLKFERMGVLDKSKNPYFEHARAEYWIAWRGDTPVGRISAQVDDLAQDWQGKGVGHFGFIEAEDDPEVFTALFKTAEDWLRDHGMTTALGPFNLSVNEETGLLVDGFEHPPRLLMGHARPYYDARLKELSYSSAKELLAYDLDARKDFPERTQRILKKGQANKHLKIRAMDKKNLVEELKLFIEIFNDAWSDNWGFVPMTENEIIKMADDLKLILRPKMCRIAYWDGEPAAFMITLPDLNQAIAPMKGKLFPFGWVHLVKNILLGTPSQTRVPLMGVKKKYQTHLSGALMSMCLIQECRLEGRKYYGLERGELSWILEDNESMRGILISIGCVEYKKYRVYEKSLV
jgi:GNAT superfamily N-acetyltransferase